MSNQKRIKRYCKDISRYMIKSVSCDVGHPDDGFDYQRIDYEFCPKCGSQIQTYDTWFKIEPLCYKCLFDDPEQYEQQHFPSKEETQYEQDLSINDEHELCQHLAIYFKFDTF
jgi:hypothetical protein